MRHLPSDDGLADVWVTCPMGHRHWGRYGAAGLLLVAEGHVLLQLRAGWSHHGGTWGLPGGALHAAESAVTGALRECAEETGLDVPARAVSALCVASHGTWSYTSVLAVTPTRRPVVPADGESEDLRWTPLPDVDHLPLHPGFRAAWPELRQAAGRRIRLVVDAANVIGSRPDGWWRDRAGAAARLRDRLARIRIPGAALPPGLGMPALAAWLPQVVLVVEGAARSVPAVAGGVDVVGATGSGDDEVVRQVGQGAGSTIVAVTSDRVLQERVRAAGGTPVGAAWLLRLLDEVAPA
jgi:8-oxo-dGTP pyrophosphatase MutT (NUDIX family)